MNIREIARLAGCSPATISRVFNRTPGVSKELSQKILKIAAERHYHPRITEKQKNVVLITPYNSVYPVQSCIDMLLMAVTQELPKQGYRVEILPVNSAERLSDIRFCAAVGIGLEHSVFPDWEQRFDAPLIFLDRSPQKPLRSDGNVFFVNSDEQMGVKLALEHLRERKCRKVGCIIHGNPGEGNASIRHAAILSTLKKLNFPCEESLIHFSGNGSDRYVELVGKLLRHGIDALFCPGGNAGITVLYALSLYNRQVPGDISLIASEQSFFSNYATPPPDHGHAGVFIAGAEGRGSDLGADRRQPRAVRDDAPLPADPPRKRPVKAPRRVPHTGAQKKAGEQPDPAYSSRGQTLCDGVVTLRLRLRNSPISRRQADA